jgi:hypothetical protein
MRYLLAANEFMAGRQLLMVETAIRPSEDATRHLYG